MGIIYYTLFMHTLNSAQEERENSTDPIGIGFSVRNACGVEHGATIHIYSFLPLTTTPYNLN